jgi:hypothetical protein
MPAHSIRTLLWPLVAAVCVAPCVRGQADGGTGIIRPLGPTATAPERTDALEELLSDLTGEGDLDAVRREWPGRQQAELPEQIGPPPLPEGWQFFGRGHAEYLGDADVGGTENTTTTTRIGAGGGMRRYREHGGLLEIAYGYEGSAYQFRGGTGFVEGSNAPIENVIQNQIRLSWLGPMEDRDLGFGGQLALTSGMELKAEIGDSLYYRGIGAVRVRASEDLIWNLGAFVQTELNGDLLVVPVLGVDWQMSERASIRTLAPGLEFRYQLDRNTDYFLSGLFEARDFRLDDQGPLLLGSFTDRSVTLRTGIEWSWAKERGGLPNRRFELYAGLVAWRELTFYNFEDTKLSGFSADSATVAGLSLQLGL